MTWAHAEQLLSAGAAYIVILSADQLARLCADLGPVDVLAVGFRFERNGVEQTSIFTVTRRRA